MINKLFANIILMATILKLKNDIDIENNTFVSINDLINELQEYKFKENLKNNKLDYWQDDEIDNLWKVSSFTSNSF